MLLGAASRIRADWREISLDQLQEAASEGFSAHNLGVNDPSNIRDGDVTRIKRMFQQAGVEISQTNGNYGGALVSEDENERAAAVKFVKRMCNFTRRIGAPNTYLRPGSLNPNGAWLPHPDNRSDRVFDRLVDSTKQICAVAENEGVKLAVEGGVVCPLYSAQRVRDFIDAVGSKALGFNQDPVNFVASLDDAYDMEGFLAPFFSLLGDVTLGAHVKDFHIVDALLVHFEEADIGSGLFDHETFLKGMQRVCPRGHVLIEHIPPERFARAVIELNVYSERAGIVWDRPRVAVG